MKRLLVVTAVIELGAGVALLCCPSEAVKLLLSSPLDSSASLTLGRVAGAALFALGIACWLAHYDAQSCAARGVVSAMVLYNLGATVILGAAGTHSQPVGIAWLPAVALHAAMTVWCIVSLWSGKSGEKSKS
jgi:Ca2+/Na+ antiporter